jgi:hypothetical protein
MVRRKPSKPWALRGSRQVPVSGERPRSAKAQHECLRADARAATPTGSAPELDELQSSRLAVPRRLLRHRKAEVWARWTGLSSFVLCASERGRYSDARSARKAVAREWWPVLASRCGYLQSRRVETAPARHVAGKRRAFREDQHANHD